jgi:peptidoglycan/LPS O-acetylase OafA/YrhL
MAITLDPGPTPHKLEIDRAARYTPRHDAHGAVHMPQLDGLRCLAVLLVIWAHAGPAWATRFGSWGVGVYGVWLFFVLSGFLITGILLRLRESRAPLGRSLRAFYARRFLRIFPAYYAVIAAARLLEFPFTPTVLYAHLLYLSNTSLAAGGPAALGHFWSLAVEEQFYLGWPLIVLLAPKRVLPRLFRWAVVAALVTRAALLLSGAMASEAQPHMLSNLDSLGLGALLAWHWHTAPHARESRRHWLRVALASGLTLMAVTLVLSIMGRRPPALGMIESTSAALVSVWLVDRCACGEQGRLGALLTWRPIGYVGTISYAVYLVQTPVRSRLGELLHRESLRDGSTLMFLEVVAFSITIAALSWRFYEGPINALKRRFPYPESA